jgi:hypothetical protein
MRKQLLGDIASAILVIIKSDASQGLQRFLDQFQEDLVNQVVTDVDPIVQAHMSTFDESQRRENLLWANTNGKKYRAIENQIQRLREQQAQRLEELQQRAGEDLVPPQIEVPAEAEVPNQVPALPSPTTRTGGGSRSSGRRRRQGGS